MDEEYDLEPLPDPEDAGPSYEDTEEYAQPEAAPEPQEIEPAQVAEAPAEAPQAKDDWFNLTPKQIESASKVELPKAEKKDDWFNLTPDQIEAAGKIAPPPEQMAAPSPVAEPRETESLYEKVNRSIFGIRNPSEERSPRQVRSELAGIEDAQNPKIVPASPLYESINRSIFGIGNDQELQARKEALTKQLPQAEAAEEANRQRFAPQLEKARKEAEAEGAETLPHWMVRKGASWPHALASAIVYGLSKDAIDKAGPNDTPSPEDFRNVALYEKQQQEQQQEGLGARLGGELLGAPGTLVGFKAGSMAASAAGATGGAGLLGRMGGTAATFAASPNVSLLPAVQGNVAEGRSPLDIRGLPSALLKAGAEGAAFGAAGYGLGAAGEYAAGAAGIPGRALLPKSAVDAVVGDMVAGGLEFPIAQQVADLVTHGVGLNKDYGVIGEIADGKYPEALKNVVSQFVMGAAFHGVEALGRIGVPKDVAERAVERGWDAEQARGEQKPTPSDIREEPPKTTDVAGRIETPPPADAAEVPPAEVDTSRADEIAARAKVDAANPEGAIPFEIADVLDKVPLTAQERKIIELRYGDKPVTHEAIGARADIMGDKPEPYARERIRQIEQEALTKIADALYSDMGKPISAAEAIQNLRNQRAEDFKGIERLRDDQTLGTPARRGTKFTRQERLLKEHNDATDALIAELEKARDEANTKESAPGTPVEPRQSPPEVQADAASPTGPPRQARPAIVESAKTAADAARDRLNKKYGSRLQSGIDPTDIPDFVVYFGGRVVEKGYDYAKFAAEAIGNFGEAIKPHLQAIWEQVKGKPDQEATGIKNATVDKELEAMGLPKSEHGERTTFAAEWDKAKETAKADPDAGRRLLNDLAGKNRAIDATEKALVAHELNRRINERDSAQEQLNNAKTDEEKATARVRVAAAKDEYKQAADIITKSATVSGQSLAFQKMMFNRDYSLAQMERDFKSAKGEKFSEVDQKQVEAQNKKIADLQKKLDAYESKATEPASRLEAARKQVDDAWKAFAKVAEGKLFSNPVDPEMIGAAANLAKAYIKLGVAHVGEFIEGVRGQAGKMTPELEKVLTDVWHQESAARDTTEPKEAKPRGPMTEEARLKAYKSRTQNRIDELTGVKEPKEKPAPLILDKEATKLKADLERAKQEWNSKLAEQEHANRTTSEKVQDTFLKWRRGFILSSPTVLSKLGSAAATRLGLTPVEEAVGAGIGKFIPGVAKRASTEGGLNVRAEAKALAEGFTTGMKDSWETLKTGKSQLDVLYGKKEGPPPALIDMIGHLHGAMKAPVKRAAYTRALEKGFEWAIKEGLDPHDPAVQTRVGVEAYKAGNRAIFMQDNVVSDAWRSAMNRLERPDPATGQVNPIGKGISTVGQAMLPIVKVPTNIVAEAFTTAFGSVTGSASAARAYIRGIDKLSPEQADSIMRQLKKGSLGLAVLGLGFYNSANVGGFYQPGEKRGKDDLQPGESRVGGVTIPSYVQHSPLGMVYQLGGTVGRLVGKDGLTLASAKALLGLVEETPFAREAVDIAKAREHPEQFAGQQAKSYMIPAAVQWTARNLDRDAQGKQVKRKTKGVIQELQSGLPIYRNRLPER